MRRVLHHCGERRYSSTLSAKYPASVVVVGEGGADDNHDEDVVMFVAIGI
jgi:hypothetical protein